jgi:prepilin peptidase CpaA
MGFVLCFLSAAVVVTALGAWIDLRTGHIPNWLTVGTIALAPLLHAGAALAGGGSLRAAVVSLTLSVGGAIVCALLPAGLYARNAIGGGDVKLFAAVGALCHPLLGLRAELYSFAFGGLYALVIAGSRRRLGGVLVNVTRLLPFRLGSAQREEPPAGSMMAVRFGPAIFAGTVASIYVAESGRWILP